AALRLDLELLELAPNALGEPTAAEQRRPGKDQRQLLAPVARRDVAVADARGQDCTDGSEHLVAHGVSVAVVDQLELVEVAEDEGHVVAEAPRRLELPGQLVVEGAAIEEPGQRIGASLAPELRRLAEDA